MCLLDIFLKAPPIGMLGAKSIQYKLLCNLFTHYPQYNLLFQRQHFTCYSSYLQKQLPLPHRNLAVAPWGCVLLTYYMELSHPLYSDLKDYEKLILYHRLFNHDLKLCVIESVTNMIKQYASFLIFDLIQTDKEN